MDVMEALNIVHHETNSPKYGEACDFLINNHGTKIAEVTNNVRLKDEDKNYSNTYRLYQLNAKSDQDLYSNIDDQYLLEKLLGCPIDDPGQSEHYEVDMMNISKAVQWCESHQITKHDVKEFFSDFDWKQRDDSDVFCTINYPAYSEDGITQTPYMFTIELEHIEDMQEKQLALLIGSVDMLKRKIMTEYYRKHGETGNWAP